MKTCKVVTKVISKNMNLLTAYCNPFSISENAYFCFFQIYISTHSLATSDITACSSVTKFLHLSPFMLIDLLLP